MRPLLARGHHRARRPRRGPQLARAGLVEALRERQRRRRFVRVDARAARRLRRVFKVWLEPWRQGDAKADAGRRGAGKEHGQTLRPRPRRARRPGGGARRRAQSRPRGQARRHELGLRGLRVARLCKGPTARVPRLAQDVGRRRRQVPRRPGRRRPRQVARRRRLQRHRGESPNANDPNDHLEKVSCAGGDAGDEHMRLGAKAAWPKAPKMGEVHKDLWRAFGA
mmetsp:Transcript_4539/g.14384  ORF Transcript_4539/g.14384 Transcript_4539/m.14384 type:complete len:224 (-) Transcript_4539:217-888(-)